MNRLLLARPSDAAAEVLQAWEKAVAGDARAMNDLGLAYQAGHGVPRPDIIKARKYYEAAAAKGNVSAMVNLADLADRYDCWWISGVGAIIVMIGGVTWVVWFVAVLFFQAREKPLSNSLVVRW